jgi:hypothetical protein
MSPNPYESPQLEPPSKSKQPIRLPSIMVMIFLAILIAPIVFIFMADGFDFYLRWFRR